MKIQISDTVFLTAISVLVIVTILSAAYLFLVRNDYDFVIEEPCDPDVGTCFFRDCTAEECPPNGLEYYRIFSVAARDFMACPDGSCLTACTTGAIACVETLCGESPEDVCTE